MNFSGLKELTIDGVSLVDLTINGVLAWKKGYKNWVPFSTEADGVTIYNGGKGYKDGVRLRSGGAEAGHGSASHTGYIPAKAGDKVRLSGYDANIVSNANAINVSDSKHTNIGQITPNYSSGGYGIFESTYKTYGWHNANGVKEEKTGVYVWTVPPDNSIAYIRVTGYTEADGSKMIVTVNEEIE
jgi:hypothetical protein